MSESRPIRSEDFGPADVECPVCGAMDNHAPGLRGLCIWCACALGHEVGTEAFMAMPADMLIRRAKAAREREIAKGTAPKMKAVLDAERTAAKEAAAKKAEAEVNAVAERYAVFSARRAREQERRRQAAARLAKYGSGFACDKPKADEPPKVDEPPKPAKVYKTSERKRAYAKAYAKAHREVFRAAWRRYYRRHRDEIAARRRSRKRYSHDWYVRHKDQHRAYMARYKAAHPEKVREWQRNYMARKAAKTTKQQQTKNGGK